MDINVIPDSFTYPLGRIRSLGDEIAWVNSSRDLYRYVPGETRPELVYTAPRGSYIPDFVGSSGGYAIITQVAIEGFDPPVRWRLWYVEDAGEDPVLVDEFANEQTPIPDVAMDDRRIAWTRTRGTGDDVMSELRVVDLDELDRPRTLLAYPFWDTNINDPALNGDELWYGIRVNDWDAGTERPRVEMLDLAHPETPPEVYGEDERAFMPAVNDEVVVWKGGGEPQDSAGNWGSVYIYWRADGSIERVPDAGRGMDRLFYPSVGHRFVAWEDRYGQLYVYDLKERAVRGIVEYDPAGIERVLTASVTADLLAFKFSRGEHVHSELRWALLPE